MYKFIYIYINAYLYIYSPHNKFKTCQPNTNFSWQKAFPRPVHRSPSHQLAFSADLVGSTHLWVTLAVSKTVGNRLSADKGEGFRGHWGAVNHNQTMEKCEGKVLHLRKFSNSDRISPCCWRFGFTFPTDTHQSNKQRLVFLHHSLAA